MMWPGIINDVGGAVVDDDDNMGDVAWCH